MEKIYDKSDKKRQITKIPPVMIKKTRERKGRVQLQSCPYACTGRRSDKIATKKKNKK